MEKVTKRFQGDFKSLGELSIIEESNPKMIRMANLCNLIIHKIIF